MIEATPVQRADALKRVREILAPYKAETVPRLIIFEVPAGKQVGVMIFDGGNDTLVDNKVFLLARRPPRQTWIDLDGNQGFWLGEGTGKR